MTTHAFGCTPLPDDLTAAIAIAIWKEAHQTPIDPTPDYCLAPGELHGMLSPLSGHLGTPMLRRAGRRERRREELAQ